MITTADIIAPHVGAWIEIGIGLGIIVSILIAPHVGAWIEIDTEITTRETRDYRTSRRCVD